MFRGRRALSFPLSARAGSVWQSGRRARGRRPPLWCRPPCDGAHHVRVFSAAEGDRVVYRPVPRLRRRVRGEGRQAVAVQAPESARQQAAGAVPAEGVARPVLPAVAWGRARGALAGANQEAASERRAAAASSGSTRPIVLPPSPRLPPFLTPSLPPSIRRGPGNPLAKRAAAAAIPKPVRRPPVSCRSCAATT